MVASSVARAPPLCGCEQDLVSSALIYVVLALAALGLVISVGSLLALGLGARGRPGAATAAAAPPTDGSGDAAALGLGDHLGGGSGGARSAHAAAAPPTGRGAVGANAARRSADPRDDDLVTFRWHASLSSRHLKHAAGVMAKGGAGQNMADAMRADDDATRLM